MPKEDSIPLDDSRVAAWNAAIQEYKGSNASTTSPAFPATPNSSQHDLQVILGALGGTQEKVNAQDDQGNTPLMLACQRGTPTFAQALIEKQAEVNLENAEHKTALIIFMQHNQHVSTPEMTLLEKALIEKSNISDKQATILLPLAIQRQNYELAEMLIKKGTDIAKISECSVRILLKKLLQIQKTDMGKVIATGEIVSELDREQIPENPMLEPHQVIDRIIENLRKQDECNIEEVCSDFTLLKKSDCFADHLYVYEKLLYTYIIQREQARMQSKNITQKTTEKIAPKITGDKIKALESLRVSIAQAQPSGTPLQTVFTEWLKANQSAMEQSRTVSNSPVKSAEFVTRLSRLILGESMQQQSSGSDYLLPSTLRFFRSSQNPAHQAAPSKKSNSCKF